MRHVLVVGPTEYDLDTLTVAELTEIQKATDKKFGDVSPLDALTLASLLAVFTARESGDDAAVEFVTDHIFGVENIECRYKVTVSKAD